MKKNLQSSFSNHLFYGHPHPDSHALIYKGTTVARIYKIGISRNTKCDDLVGFPKSGHMSPYKPCIKNSGMVHETNQ